MPTPTLDVNRITAHATKNGLDTDDVIAAIDKYAKQRQRNAEKGAMVKALNANPELLAKVKAAAGLK